MFKKAQYLAAAVFLIAACSSPRREQWEELILSDAGGRLCSSSSELEYRGHYTRGPYGAHNLFDGNPATCWSEGAKGDGVGESASMVISEGTRVIKLRNGYAKDSEVFRDNNRIKRLQISVLAGAHIPGEVTETGLRVAALPFKKTKEFILADSMKPQTIDFPFKWKTLTRFKKSAERGFKKIRKRESAPPQEQPRMMFILRLKILSVYKGAKYDDTCLSSVSFEDEREETDAASVRKKIYVPESQNAILMINENGITETLVRDPKSIFQIVDVSEDSKWLIAICMPSDISHTRVVTDYRLYNTELKKAVPSKLIGEGAGELYGFDGKDDEIFLLYADNKEMADKRIPLSGILEKIK